MKTSGLIFLLGAVNGSAITWWFVKERYEQIAEEEIASVKSAFLRREVDNKKKEEQKTEGDCKQETEQEKAPSDTPYVIRPEEFGEKDEYDSISLTYYADHILADDRDELPEDIEALVGIDCLNRFGEYETDSVYVRNDRLKCDYAILLDERRYSEVFKDKPRPDWE